MTATPPPVVHWNDAKIIEAAGTSPERVFGLLARHNQTEVHADGSVGQLRPTAHAIYQWKSRNYIPDQWRARIVYALLAENRIKMAELFRQGSGARKTPKVAI